MRPPFIQRTGRNAGHNHQERGVTLALVAVAIVSIIAMAGLSIDVGTLYQASAEAQRAADAGALAAARFISMSGITGNTLAAGPWVQICGGPNSPASSVASTVAQQNTVAGTTIPAPTVTYSVAGSTPSPDCTTLTDAFAVNPLVTVKVTQSSLPTYFSRIWGRSGSSVSATATAEVFNPSNSASYSSSGDVVPVQPRCVKPWIIPNYEPWIPADYSCTAPPGTACPPFIDRKAGTINNPGIANANPSNVIGQTFWLMSVCRNKPVPCQLRSYPGPPPSPPPPQANFLGSAGGNPHIPPLPNLEYLAGEASFDSTAIPADGSDACAGAASPNKYAEAIAGCDQSTHYQCGKVNANVVDMNENPGAADTTNGVACLTHQGTGNTGQDILKLNGAVPPVPSYPFQIQAGASNPLVNAKAASSGDVITSSTSIVSLPIYDSGAGAVFTSGNTTPVTIIGFLQVFINSVDNFGNVSVTVMNVAGCGNSASGAALTGTSPVPVRLITPP
jgi:hypothetical protein